MVCFWHASKTSFILINTRILRLVPHIYVNTQGFSSRKLSRYTPYRCCFQLLNYLIKVRDIWVVECMKHGDTCRIDVLSWLNKMTLDAIGLAGVYVNWTLTARLTRSVDIQGSIINLKLCQTSKPNLTTLWPPYSRLTPRRVSFRCSKPGSHVCAF